MLKLHVSRLQKLITVWPKPFYFVLLGENLVKLIKRFMCNRISMQNVLCVHISSYYILF